MARRILLTDVQKENLLFLYKQGYSMSAIAQQFQCSVMTVRYHLKNNHANIRQQGRVYSSRQVFSGTFLRLWRQRRKMSQSELAQAIFHPSGAEAIRQWETEYRTPSATYLLRILCALKIHANRLLRSEKINVVPQEKNTYTR